MNDDKTVSNKEIKVGDFITVLRWTSCFDNSYRGDVLEVKVIDMPFISVKRHNGFGASFGQDKITLNMEQIEIKVLAKAFVDDVLSVGETKVSQLAAVDTKPS